ncbi:MAG TPA: hypothetical protein VEH04_04550 [Verrucomicrobiae bacterium]|nr:hypothetical protein [Verrucomicrobiae bacterium]
MTYPRKANPRLEQRLREMDRINSAQTLIERFPQLKSLNVVLGYFDEQRMSHAGELRYRANVQHAKCVLTFSCPNTSCTGGGFDLSEVLVAAVAKKSKTAQGELRCQGTRTTANKFESPCKHLLHYKLSLAYSPSKGKGARAAKAAPKAKVEAGKSAAA